MNGAAGILATLPQRLHGAGLLKAWKAWDGHGSQEETVLLSQPPPSPTRDNHRVSVSPTDTSPPASVTVGRLQADTREESGRKKVEGGLQVDAEHPKAS